MIEWYFILCYHLFINIQCGVFTMTKSLLITKYPKNIKSTCRLCFDTVSSFEI